MEQTGLEAAEHRALVHDPPTISSGRRERQRRSRRYDAPLAVAFAARIFDSSLERGIPRRAAAPDGPCTRPLLAQRLLDEAFPERPALEERALS